MADGSRDKGLHMRNVAWFIEATEGKPTVSSVEQLTDRLFRIEREKDELIVYLANIYTMGKADVDEILSKHSDIHVIVNVNAYNSYSQDAKDLAAAHGVGLFRSPEFMGALYHYGDKFMEYSPPEGD